MLVIAGGILLAWFVIGALDVSLESWERKQHWAALHRQWLKERGLTAQVDAHMAAERRKRWKERRRVLYALAIPVLPWLLLRLLGPLVSGR